MRRALAQTDHSLLALLAVAMIEAVVWCLALPPLRGLDEAGHFGYVQRLAETGTVVWGSGRGPHGAGRSDSTEVSAALSCSGLGGLKQNLSARAAGTVADEQACDAALRGTTAADRGDGGYSSADVNPPLYYFYASVPYLAARHANVFTRAFVVRLANLLPLAVVVVFAWMIGGELLLGLPRGPTLRLLATAAVVLQPLLMQMAATVNPDVLLAALCSVGLWLSLVIARTSLSPARVAGLALVCVAAALTHGRGLFLVGPATVAVAVAAWRARAPARRAPRLGLLAAAGVVVVLAAGALARYALGGVVTPSRLGHLGSYLWQFYLPRLGFMGPAPHPGYGLREGFVERFLGTFGELEVTFSTTVLDLITWLVAALAVMALVALVVHRNRLRRGAGQAMIVGAALVANVALIHAVAYRSLLGDPADPIITGRYLFTVIALYGVAVALSVSWLPRRALAVGTGLLLGGLIALQLGALGSLVERFYV